MPRLPVCVLLALVGSAGIAEADHARYVRPPPTPVAPELSDRVAPLAKVPGADPQAAATTKPSIDADAVLSIDGLRGSIRAEQEQILVQLIEQTPDSEAEEKSDYYFRLGELYAKQHRFWRMKSVELAAKPNEAAKAADTAKTYLLKTVKVYKGLTDNDAFRNYPKMDLALFYYAYTLQSGKYMKEARAVYDKLLKNYPNSKFVPEAHLAFADYYADAGQLADAEQRYKAVLAFPKSTGYPYALYRLGWIDLQLNRPEEALENFSKVVAATRADSKQEALFRAAKADFVRAYQATGKAGDALPTFQKLDSQDGIDLLDLYAEVTWTGGSPDRIAAAYRELASRAQTDTRACLWQYRVARATLWTANPTAAKVKEVAALMKANANPSADGECHANASAMSGELAAAYFAEWAKTQNVDSLAYADQLYTLHVAAFPDDADARAQLAEVLWTRADHEPNAKVRRQTWQRAAETFTAIGTPDAAKASALAWMNALDIVLPSDAKVVLARPTRKPARALELPAPEAKLVAAVTASTTPAAIPSDSADSGESAVANANADDEQLAMMRLAAAITLRKYRHFDEAVTMLDTFLEHHQANARAELAANLLLDSLVQSGNPDQVFDVVDAISADTAFVEGKPALLKNLALLRSRSVQAARR